MSLWLVPALSAQDAGQDNPSTTPNAVHSLAEKTLDAIRNKDADFLSTVADRAVLYIGSDAPEMSAARFGKEISEKRGVYCVIFDSSCVKGNAEKFGDTSFATPDSDPAAGNLRWLEPNNALGNFLEILRIIQLSFSCPLRPSLAATNGSSFKFTEVAASSNFFRASGVRL